MINNSTVRMNNHKGNMMQKIRKIGLIIFIGLIGILYFMGNKKENVESINTPKAPATIQENEVVNPAPLQNNMTAFQFTPPTTTQGWGLPIFSNDNQIKSAEISNETLQQDLPKQQEQNVATNITNVSYQPKKEEVQPIQQSQPTQIKNTKKQTTTPKPAQRSRAKSKSEDTYTIKKGDTLERICRRIYNNGALWKALFEHNKETIKSPSKLRIGQVLYLPLKEELSPSSNKKTETRKIQPKSSKSKNIERPQSMNYIIYIVKKGDTLEVIARKNRTTPGKIMDFNKKFNININPDYLRTGKKIYIATK
ncbi:MAG: LysM peptidoglycan-binding domain-containing protein [Planctomycetes bacterium]|jgi:nucleoid-associated protein YgaU|nr:LysM peptidoglycan-binding domain-containing protein [Planctomycetota bacterium]